MLSFSQLFGIIVGLFWWTIPLACIVGIVIYLLFKRRQPGA